MNQTADYEVAIEEWRAVFAGKSTQFAGEPDALGACEAKGDKEIETIRSRLMRASIDVIRNTLSKAYALTFWERQL